MSWDLTTATFSIRGVGQTIMRPGFIIELYGDKALQKVGLELFDTVYRWFPEGRKLFMVGMRGGEYKELTTRRLSSLRKSLGALETKGQFYALKDAEGFAVNEYGMEISIFDNVPSRIFVNLPLSCINEREEDIFNTFRDLVDHFPIISGTAGFGFNLEWAREGEQKGSPVAIRTGLQYHGLNIRNRVQEQTLFRRLKSVHWLTFVDNEMFRELGGEVQLKKLDAEVDVIRIDDGVVFRAGKCPPIGDLSNKASDIGPMKSVNDALQAIRIDAWDSWTMNLFNIDADEANSWITRLD